MIFFKNVNIGSAIRKVITDRGISQAQLGRLLDTSPTHITRLLKKETIDTDSLNEICRQLDYNFFEDFMPEIVLPGEDSNKDVTDDVLKNREGFYLTYPHIGNRIMEWMKEIKVTQAELGERLKVSHQEVSRLLKNNSIDTGKLIQISMCLNYNFFSCFYKWNYDEEVIEANEADDIMSKFLGTEKVYYSGVDTITNMISDPSFEKYRQTVKNMVYLIKTLYNDNKELREKLKLNTRG